MLTAKRPIDAEDTVQLLQAVLEKAPLTLSQAAGVEFPPALEAFIEKEPITIVCSRMGWIRAFKGHYDDLPDLKFKEGDGPGFQLKAKTTDKLLVFASDGKFYTLPCDKLPSAKGQGEPVRLMIDLDNQQELVTMMVHEPGRKLLLAADNGKGFVVEEADVVAQTRGGKQITRIHGPFVSDDEVHRVVEYLKSQGEPNYIEGILEGGTLEGEGGDILAGEGGAGGGESDPMYDQAVAIVLQHKRASISLVQRHLRIGYNRAARLIEQMERAGLVSPMGSNGNREVIVPAKESE